MRLQLTLQCQAPAAIAEVSVTSDDAEFLEEVYAVTRALIRINNHQRQGEKQ